ncbi:MAG: response regulator [Anaerovoracaceae bacterium]
MDKSNYKILIVDDEPEYRKALSIILEDIGYTAVMCSNGLEAMEYLSKSRADLVITDLKMPVMSGIDLIKKIREQGIDTEILVITAYGSIESAVDAIKLGAFDYFVKSGSPEELIVRWTGSQSLAGSRIRPIFLQRDQAAETYFGIGKPRLSKYHRYVRQNS